MLKMKILYFPTNAAASNVLSSDINSSSLPKTDNGMTGFAAASCVIKFRDVNVSPGSYLKQGTFIQVRGRWILRAIGI